MKTTKSNVKTIGQRQSVGRPPKLRDSLTRHLNKCYAGKEFTSSDVVKTFRLQLNKGNTPANVKAGMALKALVKAGSLQVVGERETGKRGVNNKVYKLK